MSDDETLVAPTLGVGSIDDTAAAEIQPWADDDGMHTGGASTAWSDSDDDDVETEQYSWRVTWLNAAVIAVCAGLVAASAASAVWLWRHQGSPERGPAAVITAAPTSTERRPAAPPAVPSPPAPIPSAEAPAHPSPAPTPARTDDRNFLAMLRQDGFHPELMNSATAAGAQVCRMINSGETPTQVVKALAAPPTQYTYQQTELFVADAMSAYCPHAGMN
jgi:Protein of unknown function (DUF732)